MTKRQLQKPLHKQIVKDQGFAKSIEGRRHKDIKKMSARIHNDGGRTEKIEKMKKVKQYLVEGKT